LRPMRAPELDDRVGGALEPIGGAEPVPPAIDPLDRLLTLALLVPGQSSAEKLRLAADLARTLDALLVEQISPNELRNAGDEAGDAAEHWQRSYALLEVIADQWPGILIQRGLIDLAERRNRLLLRMAERWKSDPPPGFTVAAGVTTAAPAVAALLARIAHLPDGMIVLPGLTLSDLMPDEEWEALGPDDRERGKETHPQF